MKKANNTPYSYFSRTTEKPVAAFLMQVSIPTLQKTEPEQETKNNPILVLLILAN